MAFFGPWGRERQLCFFLLSFYFIGSSELLRHAIAAVWSGLFYFCA